MSNLTLKWELQQAAAEDARRQVMVQTLLTLNRGGQ